MISLGMYDVDVILGYSELEFEGDRRMPPTCAISSLEAKRLLHKGCEAYLAHVINKFSSLYPWRVCH